MKQLKFARWAAALCLGVSVLASTTNAADEPFRPEHGKFAPLEKSYSYRGELVFVDHANRRGSIRIQTEGKFRFISPSPFAMLPYGIVRYHGAPADLRDIPLGTMLHVRAFLPPDPKLSVVPVLPIDNRTKKAGYAGTGSAPAENHVLLLEDDPSYCQREGKVWKLKEVEVSNNQGMIITSRERKAGSDGNLHEVAMTFDAATRIWRGREYLGVEDLIAEGTWPASGRKILNDQAVLLGITWKPTSGGAFGDLTNGNYEFSWGYARALTGPNKDKVKKWLLDPKMAGGGALFDTGVYPIQAACYLTGREPVAVRGFPTTRHPDLFPEGVEETMSYELLFDDGFQALCRASYSQSFHQCTTLGPKGSVEILPGQKGSVFGQSGTGNPNPKRLFVNKKEIELKQTLQQAVLLDAFALAVKNNEKTFKTPGEMGLRDIRIMEKIYESTAKGGLKISLI